MGLGLLQTLAVVFGAILVVARIGGVFSPKWYKKWIKHLSKEKKLTKFYSFTFLIAGLLFLWLLLQVFELATILVIGLTLELLMAGIILLLMPNYIAVMEKEIKKKSDYTIWMICVVAVILGIYLIWWGLG